MASPYCRCEIPLLDSDVGIPGTDDDMCWRCQRPLSPEDDPLDTELVLPTRDPYLEGEAD